MIKVSSPTELEPELKPDAAAWSGESADPGAMRISVGEDIAYADTQEFGSSFNVSEYVSRRDPRWGAALGKGLDQQPLLISAHHDNRLVGSLPLILMNSHLFGRHLVSMPYVNWSGVLAQDATVATQLVDRAVQLADEHDVRYLELRHERPLVHPALSECVTSKVHMRLTLPEQTEKLWTGFKPKVRNQIRKAEKQELTIHWGSEELLPKFYEVFSANMRDLGTPVYGKQLFASILRSFGKDAELCVVQRQHKPIAAAILVHANGVTEVPSASSLRAFNTTNANMLMYWHLLQRSIERHSQVFDFGRSSAESNTYRFKKQWGSKPHPAAWQYYVRKGDVGALRPESNKFRLAVRLWQRLPLSITRLIGPSIVRGIP